MRGLVVFGEARVMARNNYRRQWPRGASMGIISAMKASQALRRAPTSH